MALMRFHIVDVFAERQHTGNQLAVVRDAGGLSTQRMQAIALEMNFSETTFLTADVERDGAWDVRIFTPREEVPFAGHPTLGTAWVIREELIGEPRRRIVLNLKVGQIPVTFERMDDGNEVLWMRQQPPRFGDTVDGETMARVLGLEPELVDPRFPCQVVSTGLPFFIVPLRGIEAVRSARLDGERYARLIEHSQAKAILLFSNETYEPGNQINARMFADYFGVPEDAATGSANGCLAGYLTRHRYLGSETIDLNVEQGYEIGRPSLLRLRARQLESEIEIFVGGKVFPSARGELL